MLVLAFSIFVAVVILVSLLSPYNLAWSPQPRKRSDPNAKPRKPSSRVSITPSVTGSSAVSKKKQDDDLRLQSRRQMNRIFKSREGATGPGRLAIPETPERDQDGESSSGSTTPTTSRPSTPPPALTLKTTMDDAQVSMAPPPVPAKSPKRISPTSARPSASAALRVPSNGLAVPPRGIPLGTNRSASLLTPTSAARAPAASNPMSLNPATGKMIANSRKKVHLEPGHSPLDWANLARSGKNLSGVPFPQRITPSQLKEHNGRKGKPRWTSFRGKVYNIDPYLPFHPGGKSELLKAVGKSADNLFDDVHPWVNWENIMGCCLVGFMVDEQPGSNFLDEQD